MRFLAERLERGIPDREPMLEVLARRHYHEHELHGLRSFRTGGRPFVTCDYTLDDRPTPGDDRPMSRPTLWLVWPGRYDAAAATRGDLR